MFTSTFWKDAAERAIKTFLQVVLAALIVDGTNIANLDWQATGVAGATAALISVLTSVVSAAKNNEPGEPATPSLVSEVAYKG